MIKKEQVAGFVFPNDIQGAISAILVRHFFGSEIPVTFLSRRAISSEFVDKSSYAASNGLIYVFAGGQIPDELIKNTNSGYLCVFNQECQSSKVNDRVVILEGVSIPYLLYKVFSMDVPKPIMSLILMIERYYSGNNTSESLGLSLLYSKYFCENFSYRFRQGFDGFDAAELNYISSEKRKMMNHFNSLSLWEGKWCGIPVLVHIGENKYPTETCYYMAGLNSKAYIVLSIGFDTESGSARMTPSGISDLGSRGFHLGKFVSNINGTCLPRKWPEISGGGNSTSAGFIFPNDEQINDFMTMGKFTQFIK